MTSGLMVSLVSSFFAGDHCRYRAAAHRGGELRFFNFFLRFCHILLHFQQFLLHLRLLLHHPGTAGKAPGALYPFAIFVSPLYRSVHFASCKLSDILCSIGLPMCNTDALFV